MSGVSRYILAAFHALSIVMTAAAADPNLSQPIVGPEVVFEETDGVVAVEAEHFFEQTKTEVRCWYRTTAHVAVGLKPDIDTPHVEGSSGGAYLEILPDTRWTHDEQLIWAENFMNDPGEMAILSYKIHINQPGRYYVWGRIFSTGTEDNGLHVGLNGKWPESGQRMQWTAKNHWAWGSKQRTEEVHTGVPHLLYLDIPEAGEHMIQFAMREDGTEFDKWMMTTQQLDRVEGVGPLSRLKKGSIPGLNEAVPASDVRNNDDGNAAVSITGDLQQWHKVTLTIAGPHAHELDRSPNPFVDYRFDVTYTHESGTPSYRVPGYFAADGNAGETSAQAGTAWRCHLSPDKPGFWDYRLYMIRKRAGEEDAWEPVVPYDGITGRLEVAATDKAGRDFRGLGRLEYVGKHHLRFAESGGYFLKAGPDAPETLLAYEDFDGTTAAKPNVPLKSWSPHTQDWRDGDPTWRGGKGKGLIGAVNYLADVGVNSISFIPYNAGGDGDNVWPFVSRDDKFHYDCSKLDQWGIVFEHAQKQGLFLHFKLQETENDDQNHRKHDGPVPTALDGGDLGPERKLYLREIVARFGHNLALNWNLGEENTQTPPQQRAMAEYLKVVDPYDHPIVIHSYPEQQDKVYPPLLGDRSVLTGASLQNMWDRTHQRTLHWLNASAQHGRPWVVCNDEQGGYKTGVPPDADYSGYDGKDADGIPVQSIDDIRKLTLWGNLMAGGAGVEYYFGYQLPQNDLLCEDWRSRHRSWQYCAIALKFFQEHRVPFWDMRNRNDLVGNPENENMVFCLAKPGEIYLIYLMRGGEAHLDLDSEAAGSEWDVRWFNPRAGGSLTQGSVTSMIAHQSSGLGLPADAPAEADWLAVVTRR